MPNIDAYCVKCREKRPIGADFALVASGSGVIIKSVCPADGCGTNMSRISGGIATTAKTLGWTVEQVQERLDTDAK